MAAWLPYTSANLKIFHLHRSVSSQNTQGSLHLTVLQIPWIHTSEDVIVCPNLITQKMMWLLKSVSEHKMKDTLVSWDCKDWKETAEN